MLHFSSKPQHRWAEGGKNLMKLMWHMIINDAGQNYNHEPHGTDNIATFSGARQMIINDVGQIYNHKPHATP